MYLPMGVVGDAIRDSGDQKQRPELHFLLIAITMYASNGHMVI